jgi:ketosteroid isomerase-like protein
MTTTTLTTKDAVAELVEMVLQGKALEAFDRFYADDVSMQENNAAPMLGKKANRAREEEFFGGIETFHAGKAPVVLADGDTAVINWVFDVTMKGRPRSTMDQVAVQQWRDGQIVSERFYYDTAA